jgi:hypothetical protein
MAKPGIAGVATVKVASGAANVRRFFAVVAGEPAANSSHGAILGVRVAKAPRTYASYGAD